ncbi:MAG: Gfo/Idh/MocA family protein [Vicinamibacterales bacterium]
MNPLRIAVVGAGAIAQRNAIEAAQSGAASIAGVYDVNVKVARDMAKRLGAQVFTSYEQVLDAPDVEAVLMSTPHHVHKSMTIAAAARGKHVMVEKPLATTLADGEAMIAACRAAGVALTVNYSFRYLPKIQKARELVAAGALGDIVGVQVIAHQFKDPGYWMGARSNSPDDWRSSRQKCGGGFLIMNVCHTIDYLYFITGMRGTRVYCEYENAASPGDVEDILSLTCRWGDRAVGSISASSIMRGADLAEERIWGTKGTLILHADGLSVYSTRPIDGLKPGRLHAIKKFPNVSWTSEWVRGFAAAVREGREPEVGPRQGWENLAFITAAYRSLEAGRPIDIAAYSDAPALCQP